MSCESGMGFEILDLTKRSSLGNSVDSVLAGAKYP